MATKKRKCRSTKKGGKNNKTKKCMDTKCKLWLKDAAENKKKITKNLEYAYKQGLEKFKKECTTKAKNQKVCEKMKNDLEIGKKMLDSYNDKKTTAKLKKLQLETCKIKFCNESCKGTVLEDGPGGSLPKSLLVKYKNNPAAIDMFKDMRKQLFGNKTSVLKDNFYEGMKQTDINKYKKEGSISGCFRN